MYDNGDGLFTDNRRNYVWQNLSIYDRNKNSHCCDGYLKRHDDGPTGKGTGTWRASGYVYKGNFLDGVLTGKEILTWPSSAVWITNNGSAVLDSNGNPIKTIHY